MHRAPVTVRPPRQGRAMGEKGPANALDGAILAMIADEVRPPTQPRPISTCATRERSQFAACRGPSRPRLSPVARAGEALAASPEDNFAPRRAHACLASVWREWQPQLSHPFDERARPAPAGHHHWLPASRRRGRRLQEAVEFPRCQGLHGAEGHRERVPGLHHVRLGGGTSREPVVLCCSELLGASVLAFLVPGYVQGGRKPSRLPEARQRPAFCDTGARTSPSCSFPSSSPRRSGRSSIATTSPSRQSWKSLRRWGGKA